METQAVVGTKRNWFGVGGVVTASVSSLSWMVCLY